MAEPSNEPRIYRGLKDVYFERSAATFIDGKAGELRYRGYSIHDLAEPLPGECQPQPDDRRRQQEQQEAEGRALLPVEAGDELRVDLLGEPQRVLAAEQRRRQVIA